MRCEIPPWSPLQPQHPAQTQQHIITALPRGMSCSEKGGGDPQSPPGSTALWVSPPVPSLGILGDLRVYKLQLLPTISSR